MENKYGLTDTIFPLYYGRKKPTIKRAKEAISNILFCLFFSNNPQGIQFYTQIKTVTSQWKAEDATLKSPTVNMPTMGR